MNHLNRLGTVALVALIPVTLWLSAAYAQTGLTPNDPLMPDSPGMTIDMVTVGNPGNAADTTGYGAVAESYQIGKYDVTIGQYTAFLNAVAATDTYSLYSTSMANDLNIAGISRAGSSGSYTYSVIGSANRPITYVSWFDSARFANWMANGQPTGAQSSTTTENGAYNVNGATWGIAPAKNATNPNTGAAPTFYIPTENQWYKAAYYSPALNSGSGGYYAYATQSNTAPGNVVGSGANQANCRPDPDFKFAVTQSSSYSGSQNYLTDVGAFTNSASFYGTFDQSGNVCQWNDLDGAAGSSRGLRGEWWNKTAFDLSSSLRTTVAPSFGSNANGFRLASPGAVFQFMNPPPQRWFDPPFVSEYELRLTGGSASFREVGISSTFGTADIFEFSGGSWIDIGDVSATSHFVFTNPGTTLFRIGNINPLADAGDPTGFPVFLDFYSDTTGATFGMNGVVAVPEPSTWVMGAVGIACASWSAWRRKQA